MKCLRNGVGQRLSGCAPLTRPAGTGGFGAASGSRGEKSGFNCPPRGGSGVYSNRPESQNGNPGVDYFPRNIHHSVSCDSDQR